MTRFVIEPHVAIALAAADAVIPPQHKLFAPTLLRSQVLALLFVEVQSGRLPRKEASRRLDYLRALQIRLLGDRVLQRVAWEIASELGWHDTFVAEYLALTKLQADALVTDTQELASSASKVVAVASTKELLACD
jgi:predicted nucleic acid-binding protein